MFKVGRSLSSPLQYLSQTVVVNIILRLLFIFVVIIEIIVIILFLTLFGRLSFSIAFITLLIGVMIKPSAHDLFELLLSPN